MGEDEAMTLVRRCSRKCLSVALALLLLWLSFAASAAPVPDDAESLRSFLQSTYGVTVLMGEECAAVPLKGYDVRIRPEGFNALREMATGNKRFVELLQRLWGALSVYPEDFFFRFGKRSRLNNLQFLLVDEIRQDGMQLGGVHSWGGRQNDIYLAKDGSREQAIHHEIWHAMEYRILCDDPDAFDDWRSLNPKGFAYTGDFSVIRGGKDNDEPDDWFAIEYGKINENEDRATVFGAFMIKEKSWWKSRPHLRKKLRFLLEKAAPVFGKDLASGEL